MISYYNCPGKSQAGFGGPGAIDSLGIYGLNNAISSFTVVECRLQIDGKQASIYKGSITCIYYETTLFLKQLHRRYSKYVCARTNDLCQHAMLDGCWYEC